jgi:hypothetical protein
MLITPTTLAYAHARRHDLEREADHARLLRAARAALRACCGDSADEPRCAPGCCDEPGCCDRATTDDAPSSACSARGAGRRPARRPRAGGIVASFLRTVWPTTATPCAASCAGA